jgi:Flp pilus assembly protein TadG
MTARARSRSRSRAGGRGQRGAAFVEAVIVLPFIMAVMLATFELGMGWRAQMTVSNASRSGARVASNVSVDPMADYTTLGSVAAGLNSLTSATVNWVTIYKITGSDITPPAACTTPSAILAHGSAANSCNTYSASDLAAVEAGTTTGFGNCGVLGDKDRQWCPTARNNQMSSTLEPDTIGVAISITYPSSTKLFGSTRTIVDRFAMRIEPSGSLGALGS